jgi:hypothetical protein
MSPKKTIKNVTLPNDNENEGQVAKRTMLTAILSFHFGIITTIQSTKSFHPKVGGC